MRTTIIPAQITTVEDKIAANLTMTQIFLLVLPLLLGGFLYISFPPTGVFAVYKIVLFLLIGAVSGTLAIRTKGKMIATWIKILLAYINRPKYFIYDKNTNDYRVIFSYEMKQAVRQATVEEQVKHKKKEIISIARLIQLEKLLHNPKANVRFIFQKKGGLNVSFSEIQ